MDSITDFSEVSLIASGGTLRYNTILTLVYRLTICFRLVPCFIGKNLLSAIEIAQLFFNNFVQSFRIPKNIVHDRDTYFKI